MDRGQETGKGLPGLLRAGPEPANRGAAPPTKLRFSETPGLPAGVFWFPEPLECTVDGWFGRATSRGCLPFSGLHVDASFLLHTLCPVLSAKTQQKHWLFFRACGVLVSVVCRWQCCSTCDHPVSPPPFEVEKNTMKLFAIRSST